MIQPPPHCYCLIHAGIFVSLCTLGIGRAGAEEPPVLLSPIKPRQAISEQVDPLRPARLTEAERQRLYEQVARDA